MKNHNLEDLIRLNVNKYLKKKQQLEIRRNPKINVIKTEKKCSNQFQIERRNKNNCKYQLLCQTKTQK